MSNVLSSFGPFGRSKLFIDSGGGRIVTKDGLHVYDLFRKDLTSVVDQYLLKQCIKHASERGNGVHSMLLMFYCLSKKLSNQIPDKYMRIDGSRAINAIIRSVMTCQKSIADHFLTFGVWRAENDTVKWISECCGTILLPAIDGLTANAVKSILLRWIVPSSGAIAYSAASSVCHYILNNVDILLFSTLDGSSVSSSIAASVTPYYLPMSEVIILGNCNDLAALAVTAPPFNDSDWGFKFVCIRHLIDEPSTHILAAATISSVVFASVDGIVTALAYMSQLKVNVVLTEDSVDENTLHVLSSGGICLIDRVPVSYLEYITQRCQSQLFYHTSDFVDHYLDSMLSSNSGSSSCSIKGAVAYFAGLKRLKFIDGNYQQSEKRASFLHLSGLRYSSGEPVVDHRIDSTADASATQIVLRYQNLTQCGTCTRLIKRCLRAMRFSGDNSRADGEEVPIVVPGGGAAEMSWSRLWRRVADSLQERCIDDVTSSGSSDQELSLHQLLSSSIVSQFGDIVSADVRRRVLTQSVFLSRSLSEVYETVPRQLLLSCIDLMDLPEECKKSSLLSAGNSSSSHNKANNKFDKVWSHWMSVVNTDNGKGPQGIIAVSDPTSLDICLFGYVFQAGVVGTKSEFIASFMELLESIKLMYRVGTDKPVKIRRKSVGDSSG